MGTALLILLSFLVCVYSQDLKCQFVMKSPYMPSLEATGTIEYSWSQAKMKMTFPPTATRASSYNELFHFNTLKGWATIVTPFLDQWIFRKGTSCSCETGHLDSGMPLLHASSQTASAGSDGSILKYFRKGATDADGCTAYTPIKPAQSKASQIRLSQTRPCGMTWDSKVFTFSNCQTSTIPPSELAQPNDCRCAKPLDVVMVLDRSSSINQIEFKNQKQFVFDFASQFEFDAKKVNMALVHFKSTAWTTLTLAEGSSKDRVVNSIESIGCPASCDQFGNQCTPNTPKACCCCCGTSISSGMMMGTEELLRGRSFAPKLMLVITDGYHNTPYQSTSDKCANNRPVCVADLTKAKEYAEEKIPKIVIYAVGVGDDRDMSTDLELITGGVRERVIYRANFTDLARRSLELIARACDENQTPCGAGCCGLCVCGVCQPAAPCLQSNPCTTVTSVAPLHCCVETPKTCTAEQKADPCFSYKCDSDPTSQTAGKCVVDEPKICAVPEDKCFDSNCKDGKCVLTRNLLRPGCGEKIKVCTDINLTACAPPPDDCIKGICTPDGACDYTNVDCGPEFKSNKCVDASCKEKGGCIKVDLFEQDPSICDDQNNCTINTCDAVKGECVFVNRTDCPVDDNLCTIESCDPVWGCTTVPVVCPISRIPCFINTCNVTDGVCAPVPVPNCGASSTTPAIVAGAIGTAALIGIIIAAVVFFGGLAGGGIYAAASGAGGGPGAGLSNNPLYKPQGLQGMNPLYKA